MTTEPTPERPSPPLDQGVPWSPVEQALAEECARQFEIPRNRAYRQVRGIMRGVAEATGASPVDTVDDWLLSDIESVIHQHCGSDGSDDAHNDWVNDLANAVAVVIRPSSNSAGIVPDPPADLAPLVDRLRTPIAGHDAARLLSEGRTLRWIDAEDARTAADALAALRDDLDHRDARIAEPDGGAVSGRRYVQAQAELIAEGYEDISLGAIVDHELRRLIRQGVDFTLSAKNLDRQVDGKYAPEWYVAQDVGTYIREGLGPLLRDLLRCQSTYDGHQCVGWLLHESFHWDGDGMSWLGLEEL